ncbi:GPI-anchored surface protein, putative [Bodo saltans]|uniref:GPI-anchored surface protein, putative n=1 Tax=Bodo saltans TaxID=75058 RepID=A0A0S4IX49_BODSA|nr:GPI-anchored surface protein, putative [Bodo saltans]|eukprot:CUG06402.1 GPI-anchored surface protein, putative [Bodo saltans]
MHNEYCRRGILPLACYRSLVLFVLVDRLARTSCKGGQPTRPHTHIFIFHRSSSLAYILPATTRKCHHHMNVVVELVVSFAQYFSTIVNIPEINFPESWKAPIRYVAAININLDLFSTWFPSLNDIRVYFMFLSVVGPLVFVVAGLLFLNEKRVVLWYLLVVFGIMVTLAGLLGQISHTFFPPQLASVIII